jgi:hypothetical protein
MARFDKLLLARYGIFQESNLGDSDVVTVLDPLPEVSVEDRRGLREMACLSVDGVVPRSTRTSSRRGAVPVVARDDDDDLGSYYRDDDERLIDEA